MVTTNDHGFLQKTGFNENKIWEIFGNIHFFQDKKGNIFENTGTFLFSILIILTRLQINHR